MGSSVTFRGIPSVFADSLPDYFGNRIFNIWIKNQKIDPTKLSPVHQLAYLSNRGMGALEYFPGKRILRIDTIDLDEITSVLQSVLKTKKKAIEPNLNDFGLLGIFNLGTSAGGARPKVLVSQHKKTGALILGDIEFGKDYHHYLIKLGFGEDSYSREIVEYAYYLLAIEAGLDMMPSKIIQNKYFATLRYDRVDGQKIHVMTATGISGYDFRNPEVSSYENLFDIASAINLPSRDIDALFRRMVFNYVFHNTDDHLKNHSFLYESERNRWRISPSYDINFALDALAKWPNAPHSLSLNQKRTQWELKEVLDIAKRHSIKSPHRIISQVCEAIPKWYEIAENLNIPEEIRCSISDEFRNLLID